MDAVQELLPPPCVVLTTMVVDSFEEKTDKVRRPLLKNEQHAAALIVYGGLIESMRESRSQLSFCESGYL